MIYKLVRIWKATGGEEEILWDAMPLSLVEFYQRFGGTYCLHLEG
jgi:hypothetical protein